MVYWVIHCVKKRKKRRGEAGGKEGVVEFAEQSLEMKQVGGEGKCQAVVGIPSASSVENVTAKVHGGNRESIDSIVTM